MSNISKHDAEEEGKTDNRQNRRVGFSKRWDTICVDNLLVDIRDLIRYEVSRWRQFSIADLYNLDVNLVKSTPFQIRRIMMLIDFQNHLLLQLSRIQWTPKIAVKRLAALCALEHVQRFIGADFFNNKHFIYFY